MSDETKSIKLVCKKINQIRKEKGLSFGEMALRCDVEKASLVRLCNTGTNITLQTLFKIANGLEIELKDLFDL